MIKLGNPLIYFGKVMYRVFFFQDPAAKREFGEQLISYIDTLTKDVYTSFKGDPVQQSSKMYKFFKFNRMISNITWTDLKLILLIKVLLLITWKMLWRNLMMDLFFLVNLVW